LRLRVYFSQDKIDHLIGESPLKSSSDPRIVSITAPIGAVRGGETAVVYAIVDDGEDIIGRKAITIAMPDVGARTSGGSKLTISSSKQGNEGESLVRPSDSISIFMDTSLIALVNCYVSKEFIQDSIEIGAYTISTGGFDASIEIYDANDLSYLSGTTIITFSGAPLVSTTPDGLNLNSLKYSKLIYKNIDKPASFTAGQDNDIVAIVKTNSSKQDTVSLNLGPGIFIASAKIPSPPTSVNIDGTIDITFSDLPLLNQEFSVYESGGNNITPDNISTYEFTSDLSGGGTINMPVNQLPTYIGLAVNDTGSLFRRTLKWFKVG